MMYWNGHMTTGGWIMMVLWTVIIFALAAAAIYWLARSLTGDAPRGTATESSARQLLDRRLASGEISIEEHAALKAAMTEDPAPPAPTPPGSAAPVGG